jgi:hypothetical protein
MILLRFPTPCEGSPGMSESEREKHISPHHEDEQAGRDPGADELESEDAGPAEDDTAPDA